MKELSARELARRLRAVNTLLFAVDGVLTDGSVEADERGAPLRRYSVRDGLGIRLAQLAGLQCVFIARADYAAVAPRAERLGAKCLRADDPLPGPAAECVCIGAAAADTQYMRDAAVAFAVRGAAAAVRRVAHAATSAPGGGGAVREVCELLMARRRPQLWKEVTACGLSL